MADPHPIPNLSESDWWALCAMDAGGPTPSMAVLRRLYVEGMIRVSKEHGPGMSKSGREYVRWYRRERANKAVLHFQGVKS